MVCRVKGFVGLFLAVGAVGAGAAAKPSKPQPVVAVATFRCTAESPPAPQCDSSAVGKDAVWDDATTYVGGSITADGMFGLRLTPDRNRLLSFYLDASIEGTRDCDGIGNCNPDGPLPPLVQVNDFEIKIKPIKPGSTAGTWEDLPGGLLGMPCTPTPAATIVHFTFWLPSGDGHWGVNLNRRDYPATNNAVVSRPTADTWIVEAALTDVAELLSWNHSGIFRRNGPSREGRFFLPFKLTLNATSPVTC